MPSCLGATGLLQGFTCRDYPDGDGEGDSIATLVWSCSLSDEAPHLLYLCCRESGHQILNRCCDLHQARIVLIGWRVGPFRKKFLPRDRDLSSLLHDPPHV